MNITLAPKPYPVTSVEFSFEQDGNEVNVLANGNLLGWFEPTENGIEFRRSFLHDSTAFNVDDSGYLTVR